MSLSIIMLWGKKTEKFLIPLVIVEYQATVALTLDIIITQTAIPSFHLFY